MFIGRSTGRLVTPFGGAEFKQSFTTQKRSAPPNGAGGDCSSNYKHVTPTG